jgi:hypothetical protein
MTEEAGDEETSKPTERSTVARQSHHPPVLGARGDGSDSENGGQEMTGGAKLSSTSANGRILSYNAGEFRMISCSVPGEDKRTRKQRGDDEKRRTT